MQVSNNYSIYSIRAKHTGHSKSNLKKITSVYTLRAFSFIIIQSIIIWQKILIYYTDISV